MIRSLRRRFILIVMASLIGTMALLSAAIAAGNHYTNAKRTDAAIAILYRDGGRFIPPGGPTDPADFDFQITPETPFETRYFIVKLTPENEIRSADLEHIAALDRRTVGEVTARIIATGQERGYAGFYRFGLFADRDGGRTVVAVDCFMQLQSSINMLRVTAAIFALCILIVFVLILLLSKRAIRPFAENLERQRRFITDASHELKTPLAILSADLGLIEDASGEDKWLKSARAQITRLDKLIKDLVELSRTEEAVKSDAAAPFSVSETAWASVEAFQPLAKAAGHHMTAEIAEGVTLRGVQDNFFRLFSILLDNAVKYCDPGGAICVNLSTRGRNIVISVSNPCAGLDTSQLPRYFDRFYRADSSRARSTGGYGIGLSTARAIVTRHRGRISNRYAGGIITFTAVIPKAG